MKEITPEERKALQKRNKKTLYERLKPITIAQKTESGLRHYVLESNSLFTRSKEYVIINTNGTVTESFLKDLNGIIRALQKKNRLIKSKWYSVQEYVKLHHKKDWILIGHFDGRLTLNNLKKLFPEYFV